MGWFRALLGVIGIGGDYLQAKSTLKLTKVKGAIRVTEKKAESIATWEEKQVDASVTSWKDEFWTIVWSVPVILSFMQFGTFDGPAIAQAGFSALKLMPDWYTYTLMTIVLASFGIRLSGTIKNQLVRWKTP